MGFYHYIQLHFSERSGQLPFVVLYFYKIFLIKPQVHYDCFFHFTKANLSLQKVVANIPISYCFVQNVLPKKDTLCVHITHTNCKDINFALKKEKVLTVAAKDVIPAFSVMRYPMMTLRNACLIPKAR